MAVYVDPPGSAPGRIGRVVFTCHMLADTVDELVEFAAGIGLRRAWLQGMDKPAGIPHFDLTAGKRAQAIAAGAQDVDRDGIVKVIHKYRPAGWPGKNEGE